MHWQIEVATRSGQHDSAGEEARRTLTGLGLDGLASVTSVRITLLEGDLDRTAAARVATRLLADPLTEVWSLEPLIPAAAEGAPALTVRRRPGVMDPAQASLLRALGDLDVAVTRVGRAMRYHLSGALDADAALAAARRALANETIEEVLAGAPRLSLPAAGIARPFERVEVPLTDADDAALEARSRDGCLALTLREMQAIQAHYRGLGREPTDIELETLAQTWSEHCKHKTLTQPISMNGRRIGNLLKETVMAATRQLDRPWCLSVFVDNAGVIDFVPGWAVCFKVETHNHPSAIEPYGGAGTGIGGVIRDILGTGLGARPILATDVFCVASPDMPPAEVPEGALHPRRVLEGIVAGVRDYGNRIGLPTASGALYYDDDYVGNPLVFAGCVGLLPADQVDKAARPGDRIFVLGGRTGRDGIHGATFSSLELTTDSEMVSSGAVQIGNPIEEKTLLEAVLAARDEGLYSAITDCGAGGLSSAVGEMGEQTGAEVELARVPLKYDGLSYAEVWISEAQERMVLAVPPAHVDRLQAICAAEGVEATDIGQFTDSGRLVLTQDGTVVGDLTMAFVHDGLPETVREAVWEAPAIEEVVPAAGDPGDVLLRLLAAPNIASKAWVVRQYDHEVQGTSVLKPFVGPAGVGPGDAVVLRPLPERREGIAVACGMNPCYGRLDPYRMAAWAIDEALRNVVAVGGDPAHAALLDNFAWARCDRPEELGSLVRAAEACRDLALAFRAPFISGKDSLSNEFKAGERRIAVPPSLLISCIARVPDIGFVTSSDLKAAGNRLLLVGVTRRELGGSHYYRVAGGQGGEVPAVDLALAPRILAAVHRAIAAGDVRSCHDLAEGGLAVAIAEMALGGGLGARLSLAALPTDGELGVAERLFSESATRLLLEVEPARTGAVAAALDGLPFADLGEVTAAAELVIDDVVGLPVSALAEAFDTQNRAMGGHR